MTRNALPQRRASENFDVIFAGITVSVTLGFYDDGRPGEVFLATRKAGTPVDIAARDTAVLMSLLLQHGCAPSTIQKALTKDAHGVHEGLAGQVASILAAEARP